ncbi:MAG: type I DNA topoisomerase [Clostridia bacterium]|nr:MAG: type I DNA topoisomerase [Clostridia bacterium]
MAKTLVIVESPAKAKTISKFLGSNYVVRSSMGHVRDLPKSQLGVDVDHDFAPKYINIRGKGNIIKELREAAKDSSRVLLAADPDREGEAIAWHLQEILNIAQETPCRVVFNEITRPAVQEAIKKPRPIGLDQVNAQQARRILDRLVGYMISPLLWQKVRSGLSAGRVQSVAVRLLCEREKEIRNFVPEEYWSLTAALRTAGGESFAAKLVEVELGRQEQVEQVLADLAGARYVVSKVHKRRVSRRPPAPFTTSTLQQEANRRLNFTAKRTMRVAQELYEGVEVPGEGRVGVITYLRTDSTRISSLAQEEARQFIARDFGTDYLPEKAPAFKAGDKAQDAHEAIRPTLASRRPLELRQALTADQHKLYKLIWERFLASQMAAAVFEQTTVTVAADGYNFRASGSAVVFPGFRVIYAGDDEEQGTLPPLAAGEELQLLELKPEQHFTQPPPRYNDASLVKALEENGIGRPSTYAPIIDTILERGYVGREGKNLVPTDLGFVVTDLLKAYFPNVIDVEFTAQMEARLDEIEEGDLPWQRVIRDFYDPFAADLSRARNEMGRVQLAEEVVDETCPHCGRKLVVKRGRYGKFLACPGFPECQFTKPYLESIGVSCPKCGGEVVLRRSKKGHVFYGCSKYPNCDYVSWQQPTEKVCPRCGERLVKKQSRRGGGALACPRKGCGYTEKEGGRSGGEKVEAGS